MEAHNGNNADASENLQTPNESTGLSLSDNLSTPPTSRFDTGEAVQEIESIFRKFEKPEIKTTEPLERIKPEDCHLIEPPRIFTGSTEAEIFLEELPDDAEIIALPYMMVGATLHDKTSAKNMLNHYGNGMDSKGNDKATYPIAVSLVETNGKRRYTLLLSESPNIQPQPIDGTQRYYRDNDIQTLSAIGESGFFQIPGRFCLRGNIEHTGTLPAEGRTIISLDLPNQYMLTDDPQELRTVAVGFNHPSLGATLPPTLQQDLLLFDGRNGQQHVIRYKDQEQQVLPWGAAGGMLVRLDTTSMQIEKANPQGGVGK